MSIINDQFNTQVKGWGRQTLSELFASLTKTSVGISKNSSGQLYDDLKVSFRNAFGEVERVSFKFPRHGVFVHYGVGKGTKMSERGNTNRKAKPWFDPVEDNLEELFSLIAKHNSDKIVRSINLR